MRSMMESQGACIFHRLRRADGSCSSIAGSRFGGFSLVSLTTAPATVPTTVPASALAATSTSAPAATSTSAIDEVDDPVARDAVQNRVVSASFRSGAQLLECHDS